MTLFDVVLIICVVAVLPYSFFLLQHASKIRGHNEVLTLMCRLIEEAPAKYEGKPNEFMQGYLIAHMDINEGMRRQLSPTIRITPKHEG